MENSTNKRTKWMPEPRIGFSERNLNRWAIFGSQYAQIERVLYRTDETGRILESCQIGAVGYKGRMRSLSAIHGKLLNILEWFFYRLGMPVNNVVKISTSALYDYLADISSMFDESKRKHRDGSRFRDWLYDMLHVLSQVVLMFSSWETKNGPDGARSFKLVKSFKMWGKHKDAERGLILIELDSEYADSLRNRNTAPLLIEVENSIRGEIAFALYRYLRQVLFKTNIFRVNINELQKKLALGSSRQDHLVDDFRNACKEIQGKNIPNGTITICVIEKLGKEWILIAQKQTRNPVINKKEYPVYSKMEDELRRMQEANQRNEETIKKYYELTGEVKDEVNQIIQNRLKKHPWGQPGRAGFSLLHEDAIVQVMDEYFNRSVNPLIQTLENIRVDEETSLMNYYGQLSASEKNIIDSNITNFLIKIPQQHRKYECFIQQALLNAIRDHKTNKQ